MKVMIKVISRQKENSYHDTMVITQMCEFSSHRSNMYKCEKEYYSRKINILLPGCVKLSTDLPVNRSTRWSFYCSLQLCIDHHSHSIIITKRWGAAFCWWTPLAGDYVKNLRFARIGWHGHLGNLDVSLQGLQKVCPISKIVPNTKLHRQNCTTPPVWMQFG